MFDLSDPKVAISASVHRALNDIVAKAVSRFSGSWRDSYDVFMDCEGVIVFTPKSANIPAIPNSKPQAYKVVVLPTPKWVRSEQRFYICFSFELSGLMEDWWKIFSDMLR